jgi:hypothetical protein
VSNSLSEIRERVDQVIGKRISRLDISHDEVQIVFDDGIVIIIRFDDEQLLHGWRPYVSVFQKLYAKGG